MTNVTIAGSPEKKTTGHGDKKKMSQFRYGESNPGLAGLILSMRAADASHYTITDVVY
jgi:hypothetical protein